MKNSSLNIKKTDKQHDKKKGLVLKFSGIAKIFTDSFEWLLAVSRGPGDAD